MNHIGEGEGSQVHGAGTYTAVFPRVARKYAMISSKGDRDPVAIIEGKEVRWNNTKEATRVEFDACELLNTYGKDEAIKSLKQDISDYTLLGKDEKANSAREWLSLVEGDHIKIKRGYGGFVYTVNIPDSNGLNYLEEDAKVSDKLINQVKSAFKDKGYLEE